MARNPYCLSSNPSTLQLCVLSKPLYLVSSSNIYLQMIIKSIHIYIKELELCAINMSFFYYASNLHP